MAALVVLAESIMDISLVFDTHDTVCRLSICHGMQEFQHISVFLLRHPALSAPYEITIPVVSNSVNWVGSILCSPWYRNWLNASAKITGFSIYCYSIYLSHDENSFLSWEDSSHWEDSSYWEGSFPVITVYAEKEFFSIAFIKSFERFQSATFAVRLS